MEHKDIAALLESMCERPLRDGEMPPAQLLALCRDAAAVLLRDSDANAGADAAADTDRITAALAEVLSRDDAEGARDLIATTAARSAAVRLDVQSALAFVEVVEQAPQSAPEHLVDELLAGDPVRLTDTAAAAGVEPQTIWSRIRGRPWSARRWGFAAGCVVLLAAGVASWSVYRQPADPVGEDRLALPAAKPASEAPAVAEHPAPPTPALATAQPCPPRAGESEDTKAARNEPAGAAKIEPSDGTDCVTPPGHQFADRPAQEIEAIAARARLDAARQAAAERAAAEAASKVGAAQAGHGQRPVAAEHFGPLNGSSGHDFPAAASTLPTTPSPYGIAPPAATRATRPYPSAR